MSLDHSAPTGRVITFPGHLRAHIGSEPTQGWQFPCINCGAVIDRSPGARPRYWGSSRCVACQDPELRVVAR